MSILIGDCRRLLPDVVSASVQTCVTSPPYWGLRDYGVEGQIGLESTPEGYVQQLVLVFREVRRTLKADGTLWLNLGDSYVTHARQRLPLKSLVGAPWRVALAMIDDGWILRSDVIWAKPNPQPESVLDRPTRAHEYLFLFSKSPRYFYDADAIREPAVNVGQTVGLTRKQDHRATSARRADGTRLTSGSGNRTNENGTVPSYGAPEGGKNSRSVWSIASRPYKGAHFATFPPELPRRCIVAASREGDTVLDPFAGSGTVCAVAEELRRKYIGIELKPDYATLIDERIARRANR